MLPAQEQEDSPQQIEQLGSHKQRAERQFWLGPLERESDTVVA
jgi:hypothetical protein